MAEPIEATCAEKLVAWPTPQDYNEAVQSPSFCFSDLELKSGVADVNEFGLPRPISGGFASVYRLRGERRDLAVRCFLNRVSNRAERYESISRCLQELAPSWAVPCEFLSNGMQVSGLWYPIVKMQWVQGRSLSSWIESHLGEPQQLTDMANNLRLLVSELQELSIAHGDLQPANIIVLEDGSLKLVDYDGMFVPSLTGTESNELGHKNFQHPSRKASDFDHKLDNFSICLIATAMEILSFDKSLWEQLLCSEEALLFRQPDLSDPDHSYAFSILEQHKDSEIVRLARIMRTVCHGALSDSPSPLQSLEADPDLSEVVYTTPVAPLQPRPSELQGRYRSRIPVQRPAKNPKFGAFATSSTFASSIARDLQSMSTVFMISVAGCIVVFVCGILGWRLGGLFPVIHDVLKPQGTKLFDAAHDDMEAERNQEAEAKFGQIINRFGELNFGLTPMELVESLAHKAEFAREDGRIAEAQKLLAKAEKLVQELPPDSTDAQSTYEPDYFLYSNLLCKAKLGESELAANGLIEVFEEQPGYAEWNPDDIMQLVDKVSETNLDLSLKLWKSIYMADFQVVADGRMTLGVMEGNLFRLAQKYVSKATPKDLEKARGIYLTLRDSFATSSGQATSVQVNDLLDALSGIYLCDLRLGMKSDSLKIKKEMLKLKPTLTAADFVAMSKDGPARPLLNFPKPNHDD